MQTALISPAEATILGISGVGWSISILVIGLSLFTYFVARRLTPLLKAGADPRLDRIPERLVRLLKYGILQYRQPRYRLAGILHIIIFAGFMILSLRSVTLILSGIVDGFTLPGSGGRFYTCLKEVSATAVLVVCLAAMVRRGLFRPKRYAVPAKYGKAHTAEALTVLTLISGLMLCDMTFEASQFSANFQKGFQTGLLIPATGTWLATRVFNPMPLSSLQSIHLNAYFLHDLIFFLFLCFLPLGKHFHVVTSLPNVFLMKLDKGTVKPVKWDLDESKIVDLQSVGTKNLEDLTWKHILDFYSCADCGRCSDQCPANSVGRPLSPRFLSLKCRDHAFKRYPLFGRTAKEKTPLVGQVLEEDEIWSCTTCGACENECPLMIEYVDKIVDLRRGLIDDGLVPQSLQKPLKSIEKRGNPYGKLETKRADWIQGLPVKVLGQGENGKTLYFVDSITCFDDRAQKIARSSARVLDATKMDFGILGADERDSGHEVKRFGEEMLFLALKGKNTKAILNTGVRNIVTSDPHAFNALRHDYQGIPPVEHISQLMERKIKSGDIQLKNVENSGNIYTYHDSCYLGRHNGIYEAPRTVIDAIPGLKRVEMARCRDRSFCCGGGGLAMFYEPTEEKRMGQVRVDMARQAGANAIVTACPFCLVQIEDGIKTSGLEGEMEVIDLVELINDHLVCRE
ncbi:MAG: (Fe-S)-binding protein [Syntrophobacteraceae bacterium]